MTRNPEYIVALIGYGEITPSDCLSDTFATKREAHAAGQAATNPDSPECIHWAQTYVIQESVA